jgi:AcrR family transcriptional regulator
MTDPAPKKKRAATVTRRYGGLDAAERRRERQKKLVDAGLEIFGRKGYHLSTVRDVCTEAGLTERYFYESFRTLGELFDAVYADLRGLLQQRIIETMLKQGMSSPSPLDLGRATLRAWYTFLQEDPRRAQVMLIDAVGVSDSGMRGAEAAIVELGALFKGYMTMLYPKLAETGYDVDTMIAALTGATIYIAKNWIRSGFKMSIDEVLLHNMAIYQSLDLLYRTNTEALAASST